MPPPKLVVATRRSHSRASRGRRRSPLRARRFHPASNLHPMADAIMKGTPMTAVVVPLKRAPMHTTPLRKPNRDLRTREHLTEREVEKLIEAAKGNRHGHRDA